MTGPIPDVKSQDDVDTQAAIQETEGEQQTQGVTEAGARSVTLHVGLADASVSGAREYLNNTRTDREEAILRVTGNTRRFGVRDLLSMYNVLKGRGNGTMHKNTIDVLSSMLPPLNAEPTMADFYTALRPAALVAEAMDLSGTLLADLEKSLKTASEHAVTSLQSQSNSAHSGTSELSPATIRSFEAFQKKVFGLAIDYCM